MTMAAEHPQRQHHGLMEVRPPGPTYAFAKGGIIIGAVLGLLGGMAQANAFTRDLVTLILWSLGGAIVVSAILGGLGWLIDNARHRRGRSLT